MNYKTKEIFKFILRPYLRYRDKVMLRKCLELQSEPKALAEYLYKQQFGRKLNWQNPTELNEKIRWMQFNTDISLWTRLADKYLARFYVAEKGYSDILVKQYGVWDNAYDVDFESLPDSFVLKTNHGCGEIILVRDKKKIDLDKIRKKMAAYMEQPFGHQYAEIQYFNIPRKIIAEELLPITHSFSSSMVDYKFYCVNGEPMVCGVFYNRDFYTHKIESSFYDMDWQHHTEWRRMDLDGGQGEIPCPATFDKMKQACRDLCKDLPFCRLDFYESKEKLYFGEFTFTPAACSGGDLNKKLCYELGEKIVLPNKSD